MTSTMIAAPHSALYFGAARNFWWNDDFVRLLAARWNLRDTARVLDVGCGIGHWGRTLSMVLPPDASVVGVDREPQWVERAAESRSESQAECMRRREPLTFPDK